MTEPARLPYPARWLCERLASTRLELTSQAGLSRHAPGHETAARVFTDYDIHYVRRGVLEYVYADRTVRVEEGQFILLPPGKRFVQREARGRNKGIALFFSHFRPAEGGPDPLKALDLPFKVSVDDPEATEQLWKRLARATSAHRDGDPWAMLHAKALLLELLARMLETAVRKKRLYFDPSRVGPSWLWRVLEEMDRGLALPEMGVPRLARSAHLSESQFAHQFRRYLGTPPGKLLLRKRMDRACALLVSHENLPVKEIAAACGFTDPFHFSAQFKKYTRFAPTDYRRTVDRV